jgi:hypothetical protein
MRSIGAEMCLSRLDAAQNELAAVESHGVGKDHHLFRIARYMLAFLNKDGGTMQDEAAGAIGKPGGEDDLMLSTSDTEAFYGRMHKARDLSQRAVLAAMARRSPETAATWRLEEALREAEIGDAVRTHNKVAEALTLASGKGVNSMAALALSRTSQPAQAKSLVDGLNREFPCSALYGIPCHFREEESQHVFLGPSFDGSTSPSTL